MADAWDPRQYAKFANERAMPFFDLAALVEGPVGRVVDLGCGPGALTARLPELVGAREVLGLDSSPAMLAEAAKHEGPAVRFGEADIGAWKDDGAWDLVFSSAALQWVPDHAAVLGRWSAAIRSGGQLAVQMPCNADHASHRLAREVAWEEPFLSALGGLPPEDPVHLNVGPPEDYATLLEELGYVEQKVRLHVYGHRLASSAAVVEWLKGTALTRFQKALPAGVFALYLERYRERLLEVLGERSPFFYPFKRLLLWGRRP